MKKFMNKMIESVKRTRAAIWNRREIMSVAIVITSAVSRALSAVKTVTQGIHTAGENVYDYLVHRLLYKGRLGAVFFNVAQDDADGIIWIRGSGERSPQITYVNFKLANRWIAKRKERYSTDWLKMHIDVHAQMAGHRVYRAEWSFPWHIPADVAAWNSSSTIRAQLMGEHMHQVLVKKV